MNRVKNMGKSGRVDGRQREQALSQLQKSERTNTELRKTVQTLQIQLTEARSEGELAQSRLRAELERQRELAEIGWVRSGTAAVDIMIDVKLRAGTFYSDEVQGEVTEKQFRLAVQTYRHYLTKASEVVAELCPYTHLDSMMEVLEGSNTHDQTRQEASIDALVAEVFSVE